jgi:3-phenylpropionate/cinnamic acid dioxygenase small subunit
VISELATPAAELVAKEAHYLDRQDWDAWLALYTDDAVFWAPAWKSEHQTTGFPETELSLMYLSGRPSFEERVWRVRSALSVASMPLARTTHMVTNLLIERVNTEEDSMDVASNWSVHVFHPKRRQQHTFFGSYQHTLRRLDGAWRIARKTVVLRNDLIPAMIDFYFL